MAFVFCHCGSSDGWLCTNCKKPRHVNRKNVRNFGASGCARAMHGKKWVDRAFKCLNHTPPMADCDMCHARENPVDSGFLKIPPTWHVLKGLMGLKEMAVCPACFESVRIGIDWALERAGESPIAECVAMAFAFQLGQYADSFPGSGGSRWDLIQRRMSPQFTVTTFGDLEYRMWAEQRFVNPLRDGEPTVGPWPGDSTVHVLHGGRTLCGVDFGVQPPGQVGALGGPQRWVRAEHREQATCAGCIATLPQYDRMVGAVEHAVALDVTIIDEGD